MPALAADKLKIGFISTLSGPNSALGVDIRDAFNLALKMKDGKLGGLPVEMIFADDQLNPDQGKLAADRMLMCRRVRRDGPGVTSRVAAGRPWAIFRKRCERRG